MTLAFRSNSVDIVRLTFPILELPRLLEIRKKQRSFKEAEALEKSANELIAGNFRPDECAEFIRRVCLWGGGHRFADRVSATPDTLRETLRLAVDKADSGQVAEGVQIIQGNIRYLGHSFASKQLRFLRPRQAVVLDSVLRNRLGYTADVRGYSDFLADCSGILSHALECDELMPDFRHRLRVCDIEVAMYLKLKGH